MKKRMIRRSARTMLSLVLIASLAMTMFVAGCGGADEEEETTTASSSETTTTAASTDDSGTTGFVEPVAQEGASSASDEEEDAVEYGTVGLVASYDTESSNYVLNIDNTTVIHDISDLLYGIFFEDINFAADGGLYAEMVQNRSFEFTSLASNNEKHSWSDIGDVTAEVTVDDAEGGLNENNTNYMVIENTSSDYAGIANTGWLDGMAVEEGADYTFSVYAKGIDGYTGPVQVDIMVGNDSVASGTIDAITSEWVKYTLTLTSSVTATSDVTLQVTIPAGTVAVDMVSLFPVDTYNGRENGLRKDLGEALEELEPAFLRFPGGCVIEGYTLDLAYDWKDSIGVDSEGNPLYFNGTYGDVAARSQGQSIWTDEYATNDEYPSFFSYGLGFYEYFLLAEDIGAVGVPVLNCGIECMGQADGTAVALDSEEMQQYIQDALDLVEFCRGDETTTWGAVRIAMGHEDPFELEYICIGNEQWGDTFYEHYTAFVEAFAEAAEENPDMYGDIKLIYSAGVDDGDSGYSTYIAAYEYAAEWLEENPDSTIDDFADAVDHHYYNTPSWFLNHADYYDEDNYSRDTENMTTATYGGAINVFLGEYAAQSNTLEAALAEAAYMTGLERNGDIVIMAAYAPLFGNLTATHWAPDLIWFNNHTMTKSINYYVQKIFSTNAGTSLLSSELIESSELDAEEDEDEALLAGRISLGTWNTSAKFDNVLIVDNDTGETLGADDFTENNITAWTKVSDGSWSVSNGQLVQSSTSTDTSKYSTTGSAIYFGDTSWNNYTFTVEATKISGSEGFLIGFAVQGTSNNYFWNIGGWDNTTSTLQQVVDGTKSDAIGSTSKDVYIAAGTTYTLKVVVSGSNVKCYIDDELYIDYDATESAASDVYQVVSTDDTGDIIIKLVNVTGYTKTFAIDLGEAVLASDTAVVQTVAGDSLSNDNVLEAEEDCTLVETEITGISNQFNYTVSQYSVTVIRIPTEQ
ncbi:MAG: hypothetical protein LUE29_07450 [Lachnospiraceae bacterium]|nr:hypothetical protein [Lachnospiraceae bacterium]